MRRIVVTGLGIIAPTGLDYDAAWNAALECRSGVVPISLFDASAFPVRIAAEVKGFDPTKLMSAKEARQSSRFVQFACGAVRQALVDAGLETPDEPERCGCMIGVGIGAFGDVEEGACTLRDRGPSRVSPLLLPYTIPNMAAGLASIHNRLKGPSLCTATACAGGAHAIGEAYLHLLAGTADVIVAGGAEAAVCSLGMACFARMNALSTRNEAPASASRPFDAGRDGFVMGEGSGVLVLEEWEHARRRGARIYAELVGYGATADAHHIAAPGPEGEGLARCMAAALRMAKVAPEEVSYINAHGTSTVANDALESAAIETVFAEYARRIPVSSTKGVTGHCLGAAGGIEAAYSVLSLARQVIPPTANYETPDPECRLDYTPNQPREGRFTYALSNSCGFGGQNACLLFRRFP